MVEGQERSRTMKSVTLIEWMQEGIGNPIKPDPVPPVDFCRNCLSERDERALMQDAELATDCQKREALEGKYQFYSLL